MVGAGYLVELLFGVTGLTPTGRHANTADYHISWDYTTWLNIAALLLAGVLVVRFVRTGGIPMLRAMGGAPSQTHDHGQHH
jgi:hypothetical protein